MKSRAPVDRVWMKLTAGVDLQARRFWLFWRWSVRLNGLSVAAGWSLSRATALRRAGDAAFIAAGIERITEKANVN